MVIKRIKKLGYDDYRKILYANYEYGSLFVIEMEDF